MHTLSTTLSYEKRAQSLARIGDLDGDGGDDYAVPVFFLPFPYVATGALLVSGRTGTVLREVRESRFPFDYFQWVAGPGDLDGDGVPDLAMSSGGTFGGENIVAAYSCATGQPLWWTRTAAPNSFLGFNGLRPADLDGDGVQDLLAGALNEGSPGPVIGAVYGLSGRDGAVLFRLGNEEGGRTGLGTYVDVVAPAPGDPFPMFVVNEGEYGRYTWQQGGWEKGRVRLYRGVPADVRAFGAACTTGLSRSPTIGFRDLARSATSSRVRVHLAGAPPGVSACLVVGASNTSWNGVPLPYDLSFLGLAGCALYTSVDAFAARSTGASGLAAGYAFVDVPLPLVSSGVPVYAQWLLFGPGNTWPGGMTQALTWPR